jgi:hypothetical protein
METKELKTCFLFALAHQSLIEEQARFRAMERRRK